ncbi:MAG: hypothetical protein Q8O40_16130 [Chloroflexota bacterium]|nr:hypothetical protein [Chloroflexota bacterium]
MRSAAARTRKRWLVALGAGLATGVALSLALWAGPVGAEDSSGRHEAPLVQVAVQTAEAISPSVRVAGAVVGSRVVVVDDKGTISAIFSNTSDPDAPIEARLGSASGPKLDTTPSVVRQYEKLKVKVDWGRAGLIYQRQ